MLSCALFACNWKYFDLYICRHWGQLVRWRAVSSLGFSRKPGLRQGFCATTFLGNPIKGRRIEGEGKWSREGEPMGRCVIELTTAWYQAHLMDKFSGPSPEKLYEPCVSRDFSWWRWRQDLSTVFSPFGQNFVPWSFHSPILSDCICH